MGMRNLPCAVAVCVAAGIAGCNETADSLNQSGDGNGGGDDPETRALASKVVAGPPMSRSLSNRAYIAAISMLVGEPIPNDVAKAWTATTQFSGFDAVPWTNLDAKGVRDRAEAIETILDKALASPKVVTCSETTPECGKKIIEALA